MKKRLLFVFAAVATACTAFAIVGQNSQLSRPFSKGSSTKSSSLTEFTRKALPSYVKAKSLDVREVEGTVVRYTAHTSYLTYDRSGMYRVEDVERPATLVYGEDDVVWYFDQQSVMGLTTYIKGKKDGNTIRFDFPQIVVDYMDGATICLTKMESINPTSLEEYEIVPDEENYVTYTIYDDGTIEMDLDNSVDEKYPHYIIGMTYGYGLDNQTWMYAGDYFQELSECKYEYPEVPTTAEFKDWTMTDEINGTGKCQIAIDGDCVYFKNVFSKLYDQVFKGDIEGDKIIVRNQFMGDNLEYNTYEWLIPISASYKVMDEYVFVYDKEEQTITSETSGLLLTSMYEDPNMFMDGCLYFVDTPEFRYVSMEDMDLTPANPSLSDYFDYSPMYMCGGVKWSAPAVNVDGLIYPSGQVYGNLYINGELFTSSYYDYGFEMTDIPYGFNQSYDWYYVQDEITLYTYFTETMESVGCQLFFEENDGTRHYSDKIEVSLVSGLDDIIASPSDNEAKYVDMLGRVVDQPTSGMYIKVTNAGGKVNTEKVIIK